MILAARDGDDAGARDALAALCEKYWYAVYAFIRRKGESADDTQDFTQEFFARLLERDFLQSVDRAKGKFRSFLRAACEHFLANERDRTRARKRGGEKKILSLDFGDAEARYFREPADLETPERLFDRRWALTLLERVLDKLRAEHSQAGEAARFEVLKDSIGGRGSEAHAELAEKLGMTQGAVKVAIHRLRRRYRDLLRQEIADTVDSPEDIEEEIRSLFEAVSN
jgi:RNA polymerase sigma-70 factor (ECF subfamily)